MSLRILRRKLLGSFPIAKLTVAYLKEKPATQQPTTPTTPSSGGGVRSAAARLLGASNGSRALSFVGGNGSSKVVSGSSRIGGSMGSSIGSSGSGVISNFDGKGTYLIFNAGDTLFISDLNSQDKDPIKAIHSSNSNPICHAFDAEAKDGHDLLIGLHSGDVYSVSLRQQLQDVGKKLVGAQHYNKDGAINNSLIHSPSNDRSIHSPSDLPTPQPPTEASASAYNYPPPSQIYFGWGQRRLVSNIQKRITLPILDSLKLEGKFIAW